MPPANQQLAAGYLERLGKVSSTPIDLLHSEIDPQDVAPGKTSTGVLAIHSQTARRRSISSFSAPTARLRLSRRRCCDGHRRGRHAGFRDCEERAAGDVHARAGQGFLQSLLDAASDPIRPVDQAKRRRFHPLLVMLLSSRLSWPRHLSTSPSNYGEAGED